MAATLDDILNSHKTRLPVVMGILNITPDSFSDGGKFMDPAAAIAHGLEMIAQGADCIDVGAESTRPGSESVSPAQQIARLERVLPGLAGRGAVLSIDTTCAEVAEMAVAAGVSIINDISAGQDDGRLFDLARNHGCAMVLMHMRGTPKTMQAQIEYQDVVAQVREFLAGRLDAAQAAGLGRERCIIDPGIGFGKRLEHNLALLAGTDRLVELGVPVLIGASRKRFLGEITGEARPDGRVVGSVAAALECYRRGATIFRVHDVKETVQALAVARAIGAVAIPD